MNEKIMNVKEEENLVDNDEGQSDELWISYKNPALLLNYVSDIYKILPKRFNGLSYSKQRILRREIARARFLGILPFVPVKKK
jgi:ribosomal protein S18